MELREKKNKLRAKYREYRRSLDAKTKTEYDNEICRRFISLVSYRYADVLLMYAPLPEEINIYPIVEDAFKQGKKVAFPRCNDDNTMTYYYVTDLSQLKKGTFGIMEPTTDLEEFDVKKSHEMRCVCFVPALVYDKKGFRLGYGKGYYDRYLKDFSGSVMGIIYSECLVDSLPRGKFDLPCDFVITEKGVTAIDAP